MSDDDAVEMNTKDLDKLIKAISGDLPYARVGVLGQSNNRDNGGSNATIGAAHEYGTTTLPQRSFLRIPISEQMGRYMESTKLFTEDAFKVLIKEGSFKNYVKMLGVIGEQIVSDAFASGGFGAWKSWKNKNYTNNANQILVDTHQLRDSITSDVK